MASVATLKTNTLIYLGTTSGDKAFPAATLLFLLNNAVNGLLADIDEQNPSWTRTIVTLAAQSSTSHLYTLPADFSKWLEVNLDDKDGAPLTEVREDELDGMGGYVFTLVGADHAVTLTTGDTIATGNPLYMKYRAWPVDLSADGDSPDMIPRKFHDLVAMKAAAEGFGLGGETNVPSDFQRRLDDRHAQLMMHVSRRGVEVTTTRGSAPQWDD